MQARPCRSCGVMVWDLRSTATNKPAPIEVDTNEKGNIQVDLTTGTYFVVSRRQQSLFEREPLHLNHFVTCPQRQQWGRK